MGMSQDNFADYFDWSPGSGCMRGSMTSKVMGAQIHTHHFARLVNHHPGSILGDWENALLRFNPFILDICPIDGVANVIEKGFETGVAVSYGVCLVPSVSRVRKDRISSGVRDFNSLLPNSSVNRVKRKS